jgi:hypothetical protein
MHVSSLKFILSATLAIASSGLFCADAQAGPFDWLFGRNKATTTYYAPHTTFYAPMATPQVAYKPVTTVQYAQQTGYRTNYARVPTTVYRPVASVDGSTGCAVTVMKPCTTWTWQARRVPYTTYRPVYTTRYVATQPLCRLPACGTPACGPVGCSTGSCATTPYAASGHPTTYQNYRQPGNCASCRGIGCANCAPAPTTSSTVIRPTPALAPTTTVPADRVPTLKVPANGVNVAPMATPLAPRYPAPRPKIQPAAPSGLQPIPKLEDQPATNGAPALLNQREHTASAATRRAYGFTPIAWPDTTVIRQMSAQQPVAPRKLDDSGWEAVE